MRAGSGYRGKRPIRHFRRRRPVFVN